MTESAPAAAIVIEGLATSFGGQRVLDGIDLEVRRGETLVILGGSGSGKSTLLRCIVGLERPDAGQVVIDGVDVHEAPDEELSRLRRRIGVAFQAGALFGSMTVAENVELPLAEFTALAPPTRRIVARMKLGMVGLAAAADKYPAQLSGGMVKRAALARALALDPDFLFFDEPSAGLDPVTAAGIDRLLIQLGRSFDVTLVVVTHELTSAFAIADRIALIHAGRIHVCAEPERLRASEDPAVRRFLDRIPPDTGEGVARFERFLEDLKL